MDCAYLVISGQVTEMRDEPRYNLTNLRVASITSESSVHPTYYRVTVRDRERDRLEPFLGRLVGSRVIVTGRLAPYEHAPHTYRLDVSAHEVRVLPREQTQTQKRMENDK
jgi:hypothetical protein